MPMSGVILVPPNGMGELLTMLEMSSAWRGSDLTGLGSPPDRLLIEPTIMPTS